MLMWPIVCVVGVENKSRPRGPETRCVQSGVHFRVEAAVYSGLQSAQLVWWQGEAWLYKVLLPGQRTQGRSIPLQL